MRILYLLVLFDLTNSEFPLTILHTNDVHARFVSFNNQQRPCEKSDYDSNTCWGGAARRMSALRKYRSHDPNVILLDAGDQYQGTIWYTALKWHPIAQCMNAMAYDAMAFGNHEFDDGINGLEPFVRNLTAPLISSNIEDHGSELKDLYKSKIIKNINGQAVGIIGCTAKDTPTMSSPGPRLEFHDEIRSLQPIVDELIASGINKIVILSHAGITIDREICRHVKGVDIVVGGHSHTFLWTGEPPSTEYPEGPYPEVYRNFGNDCLVVQAYAFGKYLGRLKVTFDDQGILRNWSDSSPVILDAATFEEDEEIDAILRPYKGQLEHFQNTVITNTAVALDGNRKSCRLKECNLGNLIADSMVYYYTKHKLQIPQNESDISWTIASVALLNGGGVRDYQANIGSNITLSDLYTILPFQNTINKITLKGAYLKEAFEHSVADFNPAEPLGKFLQISGVKVVYDLSKPNGQRVQRLRIRCNDCGIPRYEDLDMNKIYAIAVSTFIAEGGDGYSMLKNNTLSIDSSNALDTDLVLDYVTTYRPIIIGEELRIEFVDSSRNEISPFGYEHVHNFTNSK